MSFTFHEAEFDREDVAALLKLHFNAMRGNSPPEACHVLPASSLEHSSIRFFSARDDVGALLGVGALKTLDPHHGEIKSMRTAPAALGLGVGGKLLAHLIATARAMGMTRLSLETGSTPEFAGALRLYERAGFTRSGPFGGYPGALFTSFFSRQI